MPHTKKKNKMPARRTARIQIKTDMDWQNTTAHPYDAEGKIKPKFRVNG